MPRRKPPAKEPPADEPAIPCVLTGQREESPEAAAATVELFDFVLKLIRRKRRQQDETGQENQAA